MAEGTTPVLFGAIGATIKPFVAGGPDLVMIAYLKGLGDLVSRLIVEIVRVTIWVIGIVNLPTK